LGTKQNQNQQTNKKHKPYIQTKTKAAFVVFVFGNNANQTKNEYQTTTRHEQK